MAIRLRTVDGVRVALCAAETDPQPGDVYLDDCDHYALAAKFCHDWQGQAVDWQYSQEWRAMATQKLRDAQEEHARWAAEQEAPPRTYGP
jgi:hypothetical protein